MMNKLLLYLEYLDEKLESNPVLRSISPDGFFLFLPFSYLARVYFEYGLSLMNSSFSKTQAFYPFTKGIGCLLLSVGCLFDYKRFRREASYLYFLCVAIGLYEKSNYALQKAEVVSGLLKYNASFGPVVFLMYVLYQTLPYLTLFLFALGIFHQKSAYCLLASASIPLYSLVHFLLDLWREELTYYYNYLSLSNLVLCIGMLLSGIFFLRKTEEVEAKKGE